MQPTGRWRSARVTDGGSGYADGESPAVVIAAPTDPKGVLARARAIVRDGAVVGLLLFEPGSGYYSTEYHRGSNSSFSMAVSIAPPASSTLQGLVSKISDGMDYLQEEAMEALDDLGIVDQPIDLARRDPLTAARKSGRLPVPIGPAGGGTTAPKSTPNAASRRAKAELQAEYRVASLELVDAGSGYNTDEPPAVRIAAPPPRTSSKPAKLAGGSTTEETLTEEVAAVASVGLSARDGALSAAELAALTTALQRAANEPQVRPIVPGFARVASDCF